MDEKSETEIVRREILRGLLAEKSGVTPHYFQERYSIAPGRLAAVVRILLAEHVVEFSEDELRLTSYGRGWVYKHRLELFTGEVDKYWRRPLPELFHEPLGIHEPYMPDSYRSNKKFFDELLEGEE